MYAHETKEKEYMFAPVGSDLSVIGKSCES